MRLLCCSSSFSFPSEMKKKKNFSPRQNATDILYRRKEKKIWKNFCHRFLALYAGLDCTIFSLSAAADASFLAMRDGNMQDDLTPIWTYFLPHTIVHGCLRLVLFFYRRPSIIFFTIISLILFAISTCIELTMGWIIS